MADDPPKQTGDIGYDDVAQYIVDPDEFVEKDPSIAEIDARILAVWNDIHAQLNPAS